MALVKVQGIAQRGGDPLVTAGVDSEQEAIVSYPECTVTVYNAGTVTLSTIFSDSLSTPKANPFTASTDASWFFYAAEGDYDIQFSGTGIDTPFTLGDVSVVEAGSGGGGAVASVFGRTGTVVANTNDYTWAQINKATSSIADITTRSATDLDTGTLNPARIADGSLANAKLTNSSITVNAGTGMSGGGSVALGGSTTLNNAGVLSITGTANQVIRDVATGAVTLSLPQNIHTGAVPQFAGLGIGTASPDKLVELVSNSQSQLRLTHTEGSVFCDFDMGGGGILTIAPTGSVNFNPVGNQVDPTSNYDINLGQINKKYLSLYAAELWVETLVAQNTIATIGGRILVGPTTVLTTDLAPADTSIIVKHNEMVSGDRVYMEANGQVEFMAITGGPTGVGPYTYTVTRNLDGSGANQWYAGDAVFNTGATGDGFIDIYSLRGTKSGTQAGPTIAGNVRNSATYNDWTENWAIGNLKGLYGYGTDTYGVGLGKYASGVNHITVDSTNGIQFFSGLSTVVGAWDSAGLRVGEVASAKSNLQITSAGQLNVRNNTTTRIRLDSDGSGFLANSLIAWDTSGNLTVAGNATIAGWSITTSKISSTGIDINSGGSAGLAFGTTPPTSASSGTGIWLDRTGLYGLLSNAVQAKLDATTGAITAGGGNVVLDSAGLKIKSSTAYSDDRAYRIVDGSNNLLTAMYNTLVGSVNTFFINLPEVTSTGSSMQLISRSPAGQAAEIYAEVRANNVGTAHLWLSDTQGARLGYGGDEVFIDTSNNLRLGSSNAMSTSANTGFIFIRTMAGAPSGTPTSVTGKVAIVYDTTNNQLCVYNGGWKKVTLA